MNIVLVHHAAPPIVGGVERVLGRHARLLVGDGHSVTIVAARGEAPAPPVAFASLPLVDSQDPEVLAVGSELALGHIPPAFRDLRERLTAKLRPVITGADVVMCHNVASLNKNLPLTAALHDLSQEAGAPRFVLWHHDLAWALPHYRGSLHDGEPWDLLRRTWPGAVEVVVSEARRRERAAMTGLEERAIAVVPNGVDVAEMLRLSPETRALLSAIPLEAAEPLLLMPARIVPRKNIELGVRTVAALRDLGRDAGLVVTGPVDPHAGDDEEYHARLLDLGDRLGVADRTWVPGAAAGHGLPDRVVADLYALCDVLFLPSREEGFGIPVLEALLHRLPIVCADLPPLHEVAGDSATYIDPDAEPREVARTIVDRLDGDPLIRLSMRTRRDASWEQVHRRWLAPFIARLAHPGATSRS